MEAVRQKAAACAIRLRRCKNRNSHDNHDGSTGKSITVPARSRLIPPRERPRRQLIWESNVRDFSELSLIWDAFVTICNSIPTDARRRNSLFNPIVHRHRQDCGADRIDKQYYQQLEYHNKYCKQSTFAGEIYTVPRRVNRHATTAATDHQESRWIFKHAKYEYAEPPWSPNFQSLVSAVEKVFGNELVAVRGLFYYPPHGLREWHTNEYDAHGWRLYFVHTRPAALQGSSRRTPRQHGHVDLKSCSYFGYEDPWTNSLCRREESDGTLRLFKISKTPTLWHCVASGPTTHRWSFGIQITDRAAWLLASRFNGTCWSPDNAGSQTCRDNGSFAKFLLENS